MGLVFSSSSSSSSSSSPSGCPATRNHNQHQWKHDVFLSFRGEDTRDNFISHLHAALSEKGLETFIDYQLRKGNEIAPALLQAIEESKVAVVVFSKDYASSSWCLDELVKIMECRETCGLIVIPVFYNVNPSDVRKQTGTFTFDRKRKRNFQINSVKFPKWKAALTGAANLSGWDSNVIRPEHNVIEQIVKDVLEKLNQTLPLPTDLEGLVGINSHLQQIKRVLKSPDVCILGIWGMGGIGKTTVAEAIFYKISYQFEGCCFLRNIREESEKSGIEKLLEKLISEALGDSHIRIYTPSIGLGPSLTRRLYSKRILVVLDDVDDPQQLERLIGKNCWFGSGSKIIVTSRNKQAFERRADYIYEVKALCDDAALQLFSQYAFKQNHPPQDHQPLSDSVVRYCKGNPLALKVLGSFLFGKNKTEWESALNKLKMVPMCEIQKVLKISYESLDREDKEIFLHIACFFKGENRDTVIQILNSCGFSTEIGIRNLVDKSLISTRENAVEMHDLLQGMGREIVCEESKEPGERSRLWDSEDIYQVFMKDTGTRKVEGIFLNMSKLRKEIHLNPKAFENMSNLKFLKIYNLEDANEWIKKECKVHLSQGLDYLPNELRYIYWYGYPLEYLPTDFCPENLRWIELPHSNIKGLCKETESKSIVKHSLCLSQFSMVTCLRLNDCNNITSLPNNIDMKCLDTLDLSYCGRLEMFPDVSKNIKYLYLCETAIKEVPSSIEKLDQLVELYLTSCKELASLPTNICKLKRLECLHLEYCFKLKLFPEILESMDRLMWLILDSTSIENLPSSVDNLRGLLYLGMNHCTNITSLTSLLGMSCLAILELRSCNLRQLPADLKCLSTLTKLDLNDHDFESIPESIKQLTQLQSLSIAGCVRLRSLPELPVSLLVLNASGCTSLEEISSLNLLLSARRSRLLQVNLSGCFKVHQNVRDPISHLEINFSIMEVIHEKWVRPSLSVCYQGGRIPEWCWNQSRGDTVRVPLPSNWLSNDPYLGFIICLVVEINFFNHVKLRCNCHFGDDCDDGIDFFFVLGSNYWRICNQISTEHVVMLFACSLYDIMAEKCLHLTQCSYDAVLFNFKPLPGRPEHDWKVKKCGAIPAL